MGFFLAEHFFTNAHSHQGETVFNEKVEFIQGLPYLPLIEIGALLLPFGFHIIYGIAIIASAKYNVYDESRPRNWLYFFQRVSAFFALVFIVVHVFTLRLFPKILHPGESFYMEGGEANFYLIMGSLFQSWTWVCFYVVGVISVVFHFTNGLATAAITWGLTVGENSQRVFGYGAAALGVAMAGAAIHSIFGFEAPVMEGASEILEQAPHTTGMILETVRQAFA